jgi:hypothetical protein
MPITLLLLMFAGSTAPLVKKPTAPLNLTVCEAVTRQQVEAALERKVWAGEWQVRSAPDRCDYQVDGGQITIRSEHSDTILEPKREFSGLRESFPEANIREFSLNDSPAMLLELPHTGVQVFVIPTSRQYVMVSILGFGESPRISEAARRLALAVLR